MVQRLAPEARSLIATAETEARAHRSPQIEAEHLLLAMTAGSATDAGRVLASAGLDHGRLEDALDHELAASLAVVGVSVDLAGIGRPSPAPHPRRLRLGASFKASLQRSVVAASGARQIRPAHLLLGVLGAEQGTVPRALRLAGIDADELAHQARRSLSA